MGKYCANLCGLKSPTRTKKKRNRGDSKRTRKSASRGLVVMVVFGGGVAQVQLQGVPHVQCPMRPPTSPSDPHLRYSNKLDISLPRSTRYSDCSYGPISVYSGYPPQLHIGLQQISDLSRVLYSRGWFSRYWAEVKSLDFRSRPRSGLEFPCLRLLLSDKSFSSLFSHIFAHSVAK